MQRLIEFSLLFYLYMVACVTLAPVLAFLAYRKLAGIERALWAIRSELERARPAPPREAPGAVLAPDGAGAAGPRRIASSMFGR